MVEVEWSIWSETLSNFEYGQYAPTIFEYGQDRVPGCEYGQYGQDRVPGCEYGQYGQRHC